ncbi:hypothetical protein FA95DRAFT_1612415 [Auriscalpium vulgare]|uniref:Uncharacterized protein n=1 Tax=Auriscalpium vulgare TaxID=40419 RepID=A0ACB8R788_9AGAM|nr:hypothetical protein FA95DRAFT_1612415 [Auriscalpium vulgare]
MSDSDSSTSTVVPTRERGEFLPREGKKLVYTIEDRAFFFEHQQPLRELPYYLYPLPNCPYLPPVLHLGWLFDNDAIMQYTLQHLPHLVVNTSTFPGVPMTPDTDMTLLSLSWISGIMQHLGLPRLSKSTAAVVMISDIRNGKGFQLGFSLGTNHKGVIAEEHRSKLRDFFAQGQPEKWFLDWCDWQWVRRGRARQTVLKPRSQESRA